MGSSELDEDDNDLMIILQRYTHGAVLTFEGSLKGSAVCVCA